MLHEQICEVVEKLEIDGKKLLDVCLTICFLETGIEIDKFLTCKYAEEEYIISRLFPFINKDGRYLTEKGMPKEHFMRVVCDAVVLLSGKGDKEGVYVTYQSSSSLGRRLHTIARLTDFKDYYVLENIMSSLLQTTIDCTWLHEFDSYLDTLNIPNVDEFFDNKKCFVPEKCKHFKEGVVQQDFKENIEKALLLGTVDRIFAGIKEMIESNPIKGNLYVKKSYESADIVGIGIEDRYQGVTRFKGAVRTRLSKIYNSGQATYLAWDGVYKMYKQLVLDEW